MLRLLVKTPTVIDNGSDINMYGATSPVEFFAAISEYYFEQPDLLNAHHPDLYEMLGR